MSLSTIRRRHAADRFPQAFKGSEGEWRIPVDDLLATGFTPGRMTGERPDGAKSEQKSDGPDRPLDDYVTYLRERVTQAEQRATVAEALAEERRQALTRADREVAGLQQAMQRLDAGPPVFHYEHDTNDQTESRPRQPKRLRRWLGAYRR